MLRDNSSYCVGLLPKEYSFFRKCFIHDFLNFFVKFYKARINLENKDLIFILFETQSKGCLKRNICLNIFSYFFSEFRFFMQRENFPILL